jgi:A/G-specific adenine glycosylase
MLILRDAYGRVLLEKRPPAGIWGGLWCLPEGAELQDIEARLGVSAETLRELPVLEHRLSHLRLSIHPVLANGYRGGQVQCGTERDWFDREQQTRLGLPRPVADLLEGLDNDDYKELEA